IFSERNYNLQKPSIPHFWKTYPNSQPTWLEPKTDRKRLHFLVRQIFSSEKWNVHDAFPSAWIGIFYSTKDPETGSLPVKIRAVVCHVKHYLNALDIENRALLKRANNANKRNLRPIPQGYRKEIGYLNKC
ncbi:MAG: hypothetical protein KGH98_02930, partial [Candidatus Micrarchaeota archaeon]|nr:hypothetical protein [Candidatus Micrarchaeota archaeon]